MKKIISVVLACVLLSAMFVMPLSAAQSNVDVSALKFTKQPTFDGVISEEEWGAKTVTVKGSEAATNDDEEVNEFNTYMYFETEDVQEGMSYDLWLRWDAEYFYVAAVVHDPDGFSLPKGGDDIWNGDCLQMRVDPKGPNSIMVEKDPSYDYKTTEYDYVKCNFSSDGARAWADAKNIINAGFGLVKKTTPQAYDMEKDVYMTETGTKVAINTIDTGDGEEVLTCETSYEVAIPWATIGKDFQPAEETILGMSLVVLNSCGANFNAYLTWGSGICGGQAKDARKTCGGSNAVTLSADTVTPADSYAVATEEVTETEAPVTTEAPAANNGASTTKAPTTTKAPDGPNDFGGVKGEGFPVWAIILIIVAAVVVVAVVVIVVVKKKGGKADAKDDADKGE